MINGRLVAWNTHAVPDGLYSLRLRAVKQDGNYEEFSVRGIVVANTGPTETPTATPTETPAGTPTPPAEPTALRVGRARSGPPDGHAGRDHLRRRVAAATPTPPSAPPEESTMPLGLDPEGWSQAFVYGALAMGAATPCWASSLGCGACCSGPVPCGATAIFGAARSPSFVVE